MNRLAGATDSQPNNPGTNYRWSCDPFGNRTLEAGSSQAFATNSTASSPCMPAGNASYISTWAHYSTSGNNQLTSSSQAVSGVVYDPAGNVVNDGVNQYLYDADGRICAVSNAGTAGLTAMTGYIYDAEGIRVSKGSISAWSCDPTINGYQTTNDYVLGQAGEQVTEMGVDANNTLAWQHTNVFAAGKLIATYDNDGLHFYLNDPLGSRRVQTDYAGVIEQTCASLPFGEGLNCSNSNQYPTEHHFTGKERDAESGLDYFGARYLSSTVGRFMSPDWSSRPEDVPYANLTNPQTLNLYGYLGSNPLHGTDPDGHSPQTEEAETRYQTYMRQASMGAPPSNRKDRPNNKWDKIPRFQLQSLQLAGWTVS